MFDDIIGNKETKEKLNHLIKSNNISHSYSFVGPDGIGKKLFATELAKKLLCQSENNEVCNECNSCKKFNTNQHPDFEIIVPDGKAIKVEQIRQMQEKIIEKPIISNHKIYIIDNADTMTTQAQNSLLKTLEEPPRYISIILISSNENSFLPTIISRCVKIDFKKLHDDEIKKYLQDNKHIEVITDEMVKICQGSISKADNIEDKIKTYEALDKLLNKIHNSSLIDILDQTQTDIIYKAKEQIYDILDYINIYLYNKVVSNLQENNKYLNCIQIVEQTKKKLLANSNFEMSIDNLLIRLWEELI